MRVFIILYRKAVRFLATIRTGLALHDQMTKVLQGVYSSINMTISAMEDLSGSMGESFDPRSINAARKAVQQTEAAIRQLPPPIDEAENSQRRLNRTFKDGEASVSQLIGKLGKMVAILAPFLAGGKILSGGFGRLMGIDTAIAKLEALGHSGEAVTEIMDNALVSVTGTAFRMEDAVNTAAAAVAAGVKPGKQLERYLSLTADAAAIAGTNLNEMGAIFNKITTSGMIQAEELNQISDRGIPIYQMLAEQMGVAAQEVRGLASDGLISAETFLNAIERGFGGAAQTMGTSSFQATLDNIGAAISRIGAGFLNGAGEGQGFFSQVKPLMVDLLNSLRSMESRAAAIGETFGKAFKYLRDNMHWISPVIWGIVGALTAWYGTKIALNTAMAISNGLQAVSTARAALATGATLAQAAATKTATGAQIGLNAAMLANPVTWIIMGIVALIAVIVVLVKRIINLWKTNDEFAAGLMRAWNNILNFFDRIPIFFTKVGFGIANAFDEAKVNSLKLMEELVNGVIEGINWLIDKLNSLPFIEMEAIGKVEYTAAAAAEAEAKRQAREAKLAEMEENAAIRAAEREQKVLDMLESRATKRAQQEAEQLTEVEIPEYVAYEGLDHIDKVEEIGKIRDTVDISSEDLKTMRELAEMKSIQNFVTLQPSFNVQTGDIHENADFDVLVARLEKELQEALVASAEGVYA